MNVLFFLKPKQNDLVKTATASLSNDRIVKNEQGQS